MHTQRAHHGLRSRSRSLLFMLPVWLALQRHSSAHAQNIFQRAKEWDRLEGGDVFKVSLTNYGGPFDGVSREAARDGTGRLFGVSVGGCGYGWLPKDSWPYLKAVAFDPECPLIQKLPSFACGACYRFTCPGGSPGCQRNTTSVVAMVTDICPGCNAKFGSQCHADIHFPTFEELAWVANDGGGYVASVEVERVSCRIEDNVHIRIKDNGGPVLWLRMLVWQAGGDGIIKAVTQTCTDDNGRSQSVELKNKWGGVFETYNQPAYTSCRFVLTDNSDSTITTDVIDMNKYKGMGVNADIRTSMRFNANAVDTAGPEPVPPPAPATPPPTTNDAEYELRSVGGSCSDDAPPDSYGYVWYTCEQQAGWGQCSASWMQGYCNRSCGRCT